ncbi:MAG: hypothetical protein PHE84_04255 [bacterium]|nr:hypothetical protein [bacterium]
MLREEGFILESDGRYMNYEYGFAQTIKGILDEFEDIADFREWVRSFKADPERQRVAKETVLQLISGEGVKTNNTQ